MKEAFNVFDQNGDGFITVDELKTVLSSLGLKQGKTLEECRKMIIQVDVDGDGRVNYKEFRQMMKKVTQVIPFQAILYHPTSSSSKNCSFCSTAPRLNWISSSASKQTSSRIIFLKGFRFYTASSIKNFLKQNWRKAVNVNHHCQMQNNKTNQIAKRWLILRNSTIVFHLYFIELYLRSADTFLHLELTYDDVQRGLEHLLTLNPPTKIVNFRKSANTPYTPTKILHLELTYDDVQRGLEHLLTLNPPTKIVNFRKSANTPYTPTKITNHYKIAIPRETETTKQNCKYSLNHWTNYYKNAIP
ncbi:hypothetical protein YC2023_104990 [Brassica napus]